MAALIAIPYSYDAPRTYLRTNAEGTLNVLEAARRYGSRGGAYEHVRGIRHRAQDADRRKPSPAGAVALFGLEDRRGQARGELFRSFATPVTTLRPFNTFGPRQTARAFIPTIISQALKSDEVRLGSLTPERDMTFVSDTVAGFMAAGATPGIEGETINLGTGQTYSVGWFAKRILMLMGVDKPIVQERERLRPELSEVMKLVSDNTHARRKSWVGRPAVSLDDGLRRSIEFVQKPYFALSDGYIRQVSFKFLLQAVWRTDGPFPMTRARQFMLVVIVSLLVAAAVLSPEAAGTRGHARWRRPSQGGDHASRAPPG